MNLTAGVTIEAGQTVTRQTIYDLVANAQGGTISSAELSSVVFDIVVGSSATNPTAPGLLWYDQTDLLLKGYIDVRDNTGCSVWVAMGPDRFDEIFLAGEHLPGGALCRLDPTGGGRSVVRVTGHGAPDGICVVATNVTVPAGTWFAGTIEGFVRAWFPFKPAADVSPGQQGATPNQSVFPISWNPGGFGKSGSGNQQNEFIHGVAVQRVDPVTTVSNGHHLGWILFTGARYTKR